MEFSFNGSTGELTMGPSTFGPNLRQADFLKTDLAKGAKQIPQSGQTYYELWREISPELEVGLTLGFSATGRLGRISVQLIKPGMRGSEWSKTVEDDIKSFHDNWLREQIGTSPPYEFGWGRVKSIIEPHWYSANIIIEYQAAN